MADTIVEQAPAAASGASDAKQEDDGRQRRRLGIFFWAPLAWLIILIASAVTADYWPLPERDTMHFMLQAAPPGEVGEVELVGAAEEGAVERRRPPIESSFTTRAI